MSGTGCTTPSVHNSIETNAEDHWFDLANHVWYTPVDEAMATIARIDGFALRDMLTRGTVLIGQDVSEMLKLVAAASEMSTRSVPAATTAELRSWSQRYYMLLRQSKRSPAGKDADGFRTMLSAACAMLVLEIVSRLTTPNRPQLAEVLQHAEKARPEVYAQLLRGLEARDVAATLHCVRELLVEIGGPVRLYDTGQRSATRH